MSFLSTQPYKGTRDFYPNEMRSQRWMFETMRRVAMRFGYQEYDGPMLEPFELYAAKTGEEIVQNQLYWLMDRGERKLAVRPEMTPTMARMVAGKLQELPKPVRWFSIPNLWRYERPQRGRLREHWQLNVDVLGGNPVLADAEILEFALSLMKEFGGLSHVRILVNHRGLVETFFKDKMHLDAATALGATKALDARAKIGEEKYHAWLKQLGISTAQQDQMERFFSGDLREIQKSCPCPGLDQLLEVLEAVREGAEGRVVFDPKILRGLDYYTGTVFEMYDISPENHRAMCGGGRYDNLIGLFGKDQLSGVGLGLGDVTMRNFLETHGLFPEMRVGAEVLVGWPDEARAHVGMKIARSLREKGISTMTPLEAMGFSPLLKLAVKHQVQFAVLFGEEEWKSGKVILKNLTTQTQEVLKPEQIAEKILRSKPS